MDANPSFTLKRTYCMDAKPTFTLKRTYCMHAKSTFTMSIPVKRNPKPARVKNHISVFNMSNNLPLMSAVMHRRFFPSAPFI